MAVNIICRLMIGVFSILLISCNLQEEPKWNNSFESGMHIVLEVEQKGDPVIDNENALKIIKIIKERMWAFGVKGIIKMDGDTMIMQLPFVKDSKRIIELLTKQGKIEFKLVDDEAPIASEIPKLIVPAEEEMFMKQIADKIPKDDEILFKNKINEDTKEIIAKIPYLVKRKASLTGDFVNDARVHINSYDLPYVLLELNPEGTKIFEEVTSANISKTLTIVIDNTVYSAPVIREKIPGGRVMFEGYSTLDEAHEASDLSIILRIGSLPVPVQVVEVKKLTKDLWQGR